MDLPPQLGNPSNLDLPIELCKVQDHATRHPTQNLVPDHCLLPTIRAVMTQLSSESIPTQASKALSHRKWKDDAMIEEIQALMKNGSWEFTM